MIPYLIVFTIVVLFAIVVQLERTPRAIRKILVVSIMLVLSIFGGLRTTKIGTDIEVYGKIYFEQAQQADSFHDYISRKLKASDEEAKDYGYMALNYAVAKTGSSFNGFLIILQLLTNIPIIIVAYKRRKECSFPISLLIYLCLFYCRSFNTLRQSAALSLSFFAADYLRRDKKVLFGVISVLAYSMHSTALVIILVQLLLNCAKRISDAKYRTIVRNVFIGSIILVIFINAAMPILYRFGLITTRIYNYTSAFRNTDSGLPVTDLIGYSLIAIPSIVVLIKKIKLTRQQQNECVLAIEGLILYFARMSMVFADRLALYFQYYSLTAVPLDIKVLSTRKQKVLAYLVLIGGLLAFWYVKHVVMGAHEVVPYRSIL